MEQEMYVFWDTGTEEVFETCVMLTPAEAEQRNAAERAAGSDARYVRSVEFWGEGAADYFHAQYVTPY